MAGMIEASGASGEADNSDPTRVEAELAELEAGSLALVQEAFPDLRCLRCRSDSFYLTDSEVERYVSHQGKNIVRVGQAGPRTLKLICSRCGLVETHEHEYLAKVAKPVVIGT